MYWLLSLKQTGMYYNLQMPKFYIQFSPPESCRCIDCYLSRRQVCIIIYRCQSYIYSSLPLNHVDVLTYLSRRQVCILIYRCQSYIYSSLPLNHVDVLTVISQGDRYVFWSSGESCFHIGGAERKAVFWVVDCFVAVIDFGNHYCFNFFS